SDANVTALAEAGTVGIVANTGDFGASPSFTFTKTNVSGSEITIANHGFATGDQVLYTADTPIGNLTSGQTYFVIRDSANTLRLATSPQNALNGIAITFNTATIGTSDAQVLSPVNAQGTGNTQSFAASAVDYPDSEFDVANHGFTTGQ